LAKLETIDADHDPAVGPDADERIGRIDLGRRIPFLRERRKIDVERDQ